MKKNIINTTAFLALIFTFNNATAAPLRFNTKALKKNNIRRSSQVAFQKKINTVLKINHLAPKGTRLNRVDTKSLIATKDDYSDMGLDTGYRIEKIYTTSVLASAAATMLGLIYSKI
jgi:hypothetical protein